ncbi:THO complex subunit 1, partial [Neolecta irregularis DAH-3]
SLCLPLSPSVFLPLSLPLSPSPSLSLCLSPCLSLPLASPRVPSRPCRFSLTPQKDDRPGSQRLIRDCLSLCNDLLRRLSKSKDTVFRGRIAIYLSSVFPLCDPSGLNVRSDYNTETLTTFDHIQSADIDIDVDVDADSASPAADLLLTMTMDTFYTKFWSLQLAFRDPFSVNTPAKRAQLKSNLAITLAKFKQIEEVQQKLRGAKAAEDRKRGEKKHVQKNSIDSFFNPNFLTSRKLLELELSNVSFRRYILVQMLIFLDDITNERPKGRNLQSELFFELQDEKTWATAIRKSALYTLQATYPDGKSFSRTIETIFSRESNWIKWKSQWKTNATFEKTPIEQEFLHSIVNKYLGAVKPAKIHKQVMGTWALSRLYKNSESALIPPTPKADDFERQIANIDAEIIQTQSQQPGESDDIRPRLTELEKDRECKNWLALRAATRDRLNKFQKVKTCGDAMKLFPTDSNTFDQQNVRAVSLGKDVDENEGVVRKRRASEDEESMVLYKRPKT